ncbi:SDR family NAD(P)-dependent oxidoreductase [Bradyrhizobium sp. AS23.2]|uniref:SDR family NAD(P)-dependent oxidoreductase n=1 Tax=Bradyrhizobium sp. AS23.2 TaxID=1680155 RepID=UPI000B20FC1B|nr:SDR family NAD(P)-dependent oxidoreductase [Bradyrhizobium sp. AS23.2]
MSTERSLREMMSLDGRVAIITGGAGHIGRAIAAGLAELGATIALVDIAPSAGADVAAKLTAGHSVKVSMFDCDFEQGDAVKDLPRRVREAFGGIDIIVNCAAFVGTSGLDGWAVPFEQQSDATWRRAVEVNLTAPFVLIQAAAGDLARSGHGSVINISSIYGLAGPDWRLYEGTALGNPAAYAASKGGPDPDDALAGYHHGSKGSRQCSGAWRRLQGHTGAVFEPLCGQDAACAHGARGRYEGRCGLPCERSLGLCDGPVHCGRRGVDGVVSRQQIMQLRESPKC